MRINGLHTTQTMARLSVSQFNEGARSTAEKVAGFIVGALASIASFFLLPPEAAAFAAGGIVLLLSAIFCSNEEQGESVLSRWYRPVIQVGHRLAGWVFSSRPAIHPEIRVVPGEGHLHPHMIQRREENNMERRHPEFPIHPNASFIANPGLDLIQQPGQVRAPLDRGHQPGPLQNRQGQNLIGPQPPRAPVNRRQN